MVLRAALKAQYCLSLDTSLVCDLTCLCQYHKIDKILMSNFLPLVISVVYLVKINVVSEMNGGAQKVFSEETDSVVVYKADLYPYLRF